MDRLVIKFTEKPDLDDPQKMIKWFLHVFGFDEEGIEEQMLMLFTEAAYRNKGISSSELKLDTPVARSTVIYHLNRFIDSGLIVKRGRKYYFRASEMTKAIEEIEYDINREFQRMMDAAKEFDRLMLKELNKKPSKRKK